MGATRGLLYLRGEYTYLREGLEAGTFRHFDFNISEQDRAFNRGSSQNDEGELKEVYLDIEMFDSRLWMRVGKQTIVWGKTELFRTTDQFNPQDFALANLPSLEESRIPLWAWRGVWSFYEVGPLSDVRAELAFLLGVDSAGRCQGDDRADGDPENESRAV